MDCLSVRLHSAEPQPNRFGRSHVQRPPPTMTGESARVRWPQGGGGTGARGFTARCPWRRRASPVRPVGTAPDDGEERRTAKQMITAAPGRGLPHRARRALPALTSENGLWPVSLAHSGAFTAGARYRRSREGQRPASGQPVICNVISRLSWPISWRRRRMRGP
jgi:hypothetical protein